MKIRNKTFIHFLFIHLIFFSSFFHLSGQPKKSVTTKNQIYLRIELSTTSDWTVFKWNEIPNIITMRVFAVEGHNPEYQVFYDKIKIAQKKTDASSKVKIVVDFLLRVDKEESWRYTLQRGDIGQTELSVSIKNELSFESIYSYNHDKIIDTDRGENKFSATINFKFKPEYNFITTEKRTEKLPKLVLAFYYLWYSKDNWKIFPLVDQPENFYSSSDSKTIQKQIKLAKANGVDGFITSWDGPGTYSDNNFKLFLKECEKLNFKTSIYYETLTGEGPRTDEEIFNSLKFIIENYGNHKSFIKIFNKPLIFIWASNEIEISRWKNIITRLKLANLEATFIGMGYDISNLHVFDGVHQYGVILIEDLEQEFKTLSSIVKNYHLIGGNQKIWTATVQPGYDERKIPNRIGLFKDRAKGKFYSKNWEAAINSNPDLILITSWNEWWEHTHIEPSKSHKNFYLNLTNKYSRLWKKSR